MTNFLFRALAAIGIVLAVFSRPAISQQDAAARPMKKYPWDFRPPTCFMGTAEEMRLKAMVGMCAYTGWADYAETVSRIKTLVVQPDFDLIERAESELGFSRERFPTGQYLFDAWYFALDAQLRFGDHGAAFARNWAQAKGSDGYARLVEAMARYQEGWSARGRGFANTVSPEGWELYYRKLDEANAALDAASPRLKEMGPWHVLKLQVAHENPKLSPARLDLLKAASKAWPDYMAIYLVPMQYAHPKWGGSFEQMDGVARHGAEQSRDKLGAGMYALLYERLYRGNGESNYTLRDTSVDWELMKKGFRDLEARGSHPVWIWSNFAALACQMRDRDEARRLYALNDKSKGPAASPEASACRAFAASDK